jgi:hypothetical protein
MIAVWCQIRRDRTDVVREIDIFREPPDRLVRFG